MTAADSIGRSLQDVQTPAAVLDLAKVEANCQRMLDAVDKAGVSWRAHVKTHKTLQISALQCGTTRPINLIVSTLVEAENLVPWLKTQADSGRDVNILYGIPLPPSSLPRIGKIQSTLGPKSVAVHIDHPSQLTSLSSLPYPPLVYIKIDMGYSRAGVPPTSPQLASLITAVLESETKGNCILHGLYAHAGNSYSARTWDEANAYLNAEIRALVSATSHLTSSRIEGAKPLVLSLGATPTAGILASPLFSPASLADLKLNGFVPEVHAGVYTTLDLQQLAVHSGGLLSHNDLALTLLAEVTSVYPDRGNGEAMAVAGTLALGREPIGRLPPKEERKGPVYDYYGLLTPWGLGDKQPLPGASFPCDQTGWVVGKVSQEHAVLMWTGQGSNKPDLQVGQKIRIWPNHACVTGAMHDYYLIVDSRREGKEDEVVDVWPRWRGW